ncbi:hypothetical protein [Arthrobacter sp. H5]|uniref:hypothetical protein n=1 Tax=Arthrobacter sp. H5 TaxID=1267973 RepID=UPI000487E0E2|nr:hypothetical protein [Arthrobacter sp. H5]
MTTNSRPAAAGVKCLPNRLPGMEGTYGQQWFVDVPEEDPLVRIVMISPGMRLTGTFRPISDGRFTDTFTIANGR